MRVTPTTARQVSFSCLIHGCGGGVFSWLWPKTALQYRSRPRNGRNSSFERL